MCICILPYSCIHCISPYLSVFQPRIKTFLSRIQLCFTQCKLKNASSNSINLKSKVDKLDVDKLVPVPVDLSKLSHAVKNNVVKKMYTKHSLVPSSEDSIRKGFIKFPLDIKMRDQIL